MVAFWEVALVMRHEGEGLSASVMADIHNYLGHSCASRGRQIVFSPVWQHRELA
jgi:hypothetical protein